jgi:hypothetical protein
MPHLGFWTPHEIADELDLSATFVLRIINNELPYQFIQATKVSGRWLIETPEAERFISQYRSSGKTRAKDFYSPQDLAKAIDKSRKYVLDALTGYGGRKEPRLAGEKRGERWVISREEGDRFIGEHGKGKSSDP